MATMLDVAKKAGVALSTVSYAINGTRPISEDTRQRIFAAMEELHYKPHVLARGLASRRSRIIALLIAAPERGLGSTELEFVTSAADAARENGYHLVLWTSEMHDHDGLHQLTQQGLTEGAIVMEVHLNDDRVNLLRQLGIPFTMIGRCADTSGIAYVDIDFDRTARDAVNYLAGLGHRGIGFLNHSQTEFQAGYGPAVRAEIAFHAATAEAGIEGVSLLCPATPPAGREALTTMLAAHPTLTAAIVMNDRALPGVMQAIEDRGWRVPSDFSVISMVTSDVVAEMMIPPTTSMAAPGAELGRMGVELLIRQLESGELDAPQELVSCPLIVRGSTGAVAHARQQLDGVR